MCVVLVPNIGFSTSISNTTQIRTQQFRNLMCVHWECAWCQCQIQVLAPANPTVHIYAHGTSETSCVSTGNVCGASTKYWSQKNHIQHFTNAPTALHKRHVCTLGICMVLYSAKYWYQHQHIQQYTNMPIALQKLHVCPVGMCVVLVPIIGISTNVSDTTQIRPQYFRNFMCVHWECAWCQYQILVLAPAYPTLHKYTHSSSETSCVSIWNVCGVSIKYWSQNHSIQHYTNTPTAGQKLHVCPLGMCVVLMPNIDLRTTISNSTKMRPLYFRTFTGVDWECAWCQYQILVLAPAYPTLHKYAHSSSETSCASTRNVRGARAKHWSQNHHIQCYTNTPTALKKTHVFLLGMCVVLVPNIGISTSISNTTKLRPQKFRNFIRVHWVCAWCYCQILVLKPPYPTLHKHSHSTSETSCVSTGNVRGASAKYWHQYQRIQHYTNTPTALQKLHVCPLGMCVVLVPNFGINTSIFNTIQIPHNTSETSCVSTGNVRGASKIIGLGTTISNTKQVRAQYLRNLMCVYWECAWCQCQILVLAPAHPTLYKYAHSTSKTSCVSTGNVRSASTKYQYYRQHN